MSKDVPAFLPREALQRLIDALRATGRRCVGPLVREEAIVFGTLETAAQLPCGIRDRQAPGSYRIERLDSPRCFAWANGP